MPVWISWTLGSLFLLLVLLNPASARAQVRTATAEPEGVLTIAATTLSELRNWDTTIDRLLQSRELVEHDLRDDPVLPGRRHETLLQHYQGVQVYGGTVSRQISGGVTVSVLGTLLTGITVDPVPSLSVDEVITILRDVSGGTLMGTNAPQLSVFRALNGTYTLTYRATMSDTKTYFIDAATGQVVWTAEAIRTQGEVGVGTGVLGDSKKVSTTEGAGTFRTHDQLRPAQIRTYDTRGSEAVFDRVHLGGVVFDSDFATDSDNTWTTPSVVDAHVHTGWTEDYFFKHHNWTGVNNANGTITSIVHSGLGLQNNAFFISPPFGPEGLGALAFGNTSAGVPLTALDIVAHEFMHGVTHASVSQRTGDGLGRRLFVDSIGPTAFTFGGSVFPCGTTIFVSADRTVPPLCDGGHYVVASNHPGAVNEAFSDVFGTGVEFSFQNPGSGLLRADYVVGEDVLGFGPIRAMDAPQSIGVASTTSQIPYPDHASRLFSFIVVITQGTRANPTAFGLVPLVFFNGNIFQLFGDDFGGEHINSTVLSHAFYLAIEGGLNATSGISVQGVGSANRAQIEQAFFRAMTVLMPNVPPMPLAALATYQAAVDLYGADGAATQAILQAMVAVGLLVLA